MDITIKYRMTNETRVVHGHTLHRIECINAFQVLPYYKILPGQKGGWIESLDNLDMTDNSWVNGDACVFEDARVTGDSYVSENAIVRGSAFVSDHSHVFGSAEITEHAHVYRNSIIQGDAVVTGCASVVSSYVMMNAAISGNAKVEHNSFVSGSAIISCNAIVTSAHITGNAVVKHTFDYIVFKNNWSSGRYFTWTKSNDMWSVGCFYGTGEQLIEKAYKDSEDKGKHYEMYVKLVEQLKELDKAKEVKNNEVN